MIQTTIIPDSTTVNINIPKNYVGKKVYAIFYIDEEITTNIDIPTTQKPSDFFGTLNPKEDTNMHLHQTENRNRKVLKISQLVESLTGIIPDDSQNGDDFFEYLTKKYS